MPTTRSKANSDGGAAADAETGSKHQLADADKSKNGEKAAKKQKTLEESFENG